MTPLVKVQGAVFAEPFSNPGLPMICVVVPPPVETVKETVVLWETPPPLALIVTVEVPVVAVLLAVNVSVELPEPGAAIDAGLKLAVTPAGSPLAESEMAELKPPETVVETVVAFVPPCATETLVGEAVIAKSGVGVPGLKITSSTGWSSIPLGATPVCP